MAKYRILSKKNGFGEIFFVQQRFLFLWRDLPASPFTEYEKAKNYFDKLLAPTFYQIINIK